MEDESQKAIGFSQTLSAKADNVLLLLSTRLLLVAIYKIQELTLHCTHFFHHTILIFVARSPDIFQKPSDLFPRAS